MNHSISPIDTNTLAKHIHDHQLADRDAQAYALVYGVAYPSLYQELHQWFGFETVRFRLALIFDARLADRCDQYGPYLVSLAAGSLKPSKLLMQLAGCCVNDYRGVSFLFSPLDIATLASGLRARLDVICEDRSQWQMKFFDTRSLSVLERILLPEQRHSYFSLVTSWRYLDRYGQLQNIDGAFTTAKTYHAPLYLSEAQAAALIDAGLPDLVLHSLSVVDADLFAAFDACTRYAICEETIASASAEERDSPLRLTQLVGHALRRAQADAQGGGDL